MNKAPSFALSYIDNLDAVYQLNKDKGKIVVITFWTSWCPDCARDLPKKEQLYQSIDKSKLKMLTINVPGRERNPNDGVDYFNKFLTQDTLIDNGREVYELYNCHGVPTTIIIDPNGNIYRQYDDSADFLDIVKAIGDLVSVF